MGNDITQVCAQAGISVVMSDLSKETLDGALQKISWSVSKFIEKGKIAEDVNTIMNRIEVTTDDDGAVDSDLVRKSKNNCTLSITTKKRS